jgi:hypothetical protein
VVVEEKRCDHGGGEAVRPRVKKEKSRVERKHIGGVARKAGVRK